MNTSIRRPVLSAVLAALCVIASATYAQNTAPGGLGEQAQPPAVEAPDANAPTTSETPAVENETPAVEAPNTESQQSEGGPSGWQHDRQSHDDDLVSVGGDSRLAAGHSAESVVSVFGSSTSEGDVSDAVVSVLGDTRISAGTVGDAAVSVLGDNYVNAKVAGDVVAVLGDLELGPDAEIGGDVVVVGGVIHRDARAVVHGGERNVFAMPLGFRWLRPWIEHCLLYVRPLAFAPGLGWAWGLALGFLALYVLIALVFSNTVDRCVRTLQSYPGQSIVASLLTMLLTPVLFALLFITVIGIAFVPLAVAGLFAAGAFGKVVVLAWLGRCCTKFLGEGAYVHSALAVLTGGVVVLGLYLVPVVGFLVYKLLGILGLGVAVYALLLAVRARRNGTGPQPAFAGASPGPGAGTPTFGEPYVGEATTSGFADANSATSGSATGSGTSAEPAASADFSTTSAGVTSAGPSSAGATSAGATSAGATSPGATSPGATSPGATSPGATSPGATSPGATSSGAASPPPGAGSASSGVPLSALPRAGFMVRMGALFIDAVIVATLLRVLSHSQEAVLVALAIYGAVMWKLKSTTIGGIVFGLQVVRVDGRPIDWPTAVVRALSCFLSIAVVGLGFFWIAIDEGRQAWHDKIAGTAVVRMPKGVSLL